MSTTPTGDLVLQSIPLPADTNGNGDIFGGWLMAQMDLGGSVTARQRSRGRVATVAVDAMTFLKPVHVGDILSIHAWLASEGTTSMTVTIEAWTRRLPEDDPIKVTEGRFVYVAIDDDGRKRRLP